jgi:hypothetical protein
MLKVCVRCDDWDEIGEVRNEKHRENRQEDGGISHAPPRFLHGPKRANCFANPNIVPTLLRHERGEFGDHQSHRQAPYQRGEEHKENCPARTNSSYQRLKAERAPRGREEYERNEREQSEATFPRNARRIAWHGLRR